MSHYFKKYNNNLFCQISKTHAIFHCQILPKNKNEGLLNKRYRMKVYNENLR